MCVCVLLPHFLFLLLHLTLIIICLIIMINFGPLLLLLLLLLLLPQVSHFISWVKRYARAAVGSCGAECARGDDGDADRDE